MKANFILFFIIFFCIFGRSQEVYSTPSGKKFHRASCRMVENVSHKLLSDGEIAKKGLTPCKICKPVFIGKSNSFKRSADKSVGESTSVQCKGKTKAGTRCKHRTKLANGYCYQHTSQNSGIKSTQTIKSSQPVSGVCGARTQSGGSCKRIVKNGGRCYQH